MKLTALRVPLIEFDEHVVADPNLEQAGYLAAMLVRV
jgi:hypothetical protein